MKPEIINGIFAISGAVIGSFITALFSIWSAHKEKKNKSLSIISTYSTKLIEISDLIRSNIEIKMNNKTIKELYKNEIIIINTGNLLINNIPIEFDIKGEEAELINIELDRSNFNISSEDYKFTIKPDSGKIDLEYLNPGDEISFILLTNKKTKITLKHRQQEVVTSIENNYYPESPGIITERFFEMLSRNLLFKSAYRFVLPGFGKYLKNKQRKTLHNVYKP